MTYTQLAVLGVLIATVLDLYVFKTKLLRRRVFWVSYSIVVFFQLVTNGILTGFGIVEYDGAAIIGSTTPQDEPPTFIGDGRLVYAPIEDLLFGFALVLGVMDMWEFWGRSGMQRDPNPNKARGKN